MSNNFEAAASSLIEVDLYKSSKRNTPNNKGANVSVIDFSAGRDSTCVDLHWHHPRGFKALPDDKKDELRQWQKYQEGRKSLDNSKKDALDKKQNKGDSDGGYDNKSQSSIDPPLQDTPTSTNSTVSSTSQQLNSSSVSLSDTYIDISARLNIILKKSS